MIQSSSCVEINECEFNDNKCESNGGAICVTTKAVLVVRNSKFENNQARHGNSVYCRKKRIICDGNSFNGRKVWNDLDIFFEKK